MTRLLAPLLAVALAAGQPAPDARQRSFDIVWKTIKEHHFDPTFGGVDWDGVRTRYAPKVAAATTDRQLHQLLQDMVGELKLSHFGIIAPESFLEDPGPDPSLGGAGIEVRSSNGEALITKVEPGSGAAQAGVRAGFILRQVGATPVSEILARVAKTGRPEIRQRLLATRILQNTVDGPPGTSVKLIFVDGQGTAREADVKRSPKKGEMSARMGNMPPQYTEFESKRLESGVGYVRFSLFVISLMDRVRQAIRSMSDAPGIIFDVRGNPGGVVGMTGGIAGLIETRETSLGSMQMRTGHINAAVFPQPNPYLGPVVVLVDAASASSSEIFAAGLQAIGRATVVGERSQGAALPSVLQRLPTGAGFQYAIADFKAPNNVMIEGQGVIPDIEVKLDRASLLAGRDAQLDAAVAHIQKAAQKNKEKKP